MLPGRFATTHWSVVLAARDRASPQAREALARLCTGYWYPLYAFARRLGRQPDDAQDLTQGFFSQLLEKQYLDDAERGRGRFRSFLLAAFKHFLAKERERDHAQKRGGGRTILPLDVDSGERRYQLEPAHELTPERIFERRWALAMLDQVLARLRNEFIQKDKEQHFDCLKAYLTGESGAPSQAQAAAELGLNEGAVKVAVHRLRRRYRELVRDEIAQTVADPADIDDELAFLFAALRENR